jgi:ribosome-associated protein
MKAAAGKKAFDLVLLEMKGVASFTDYFLICSGKSDRQVQAIASHIEEKLGKQGLHPLGIEGQREGRWVLLDYGDVVIHIFYHPIREFYDLETFRSRAEFFAKASLYQLYFNLARPNSHKAGLTPWQIIHQLAPCLPLDLCLLPPVLLDYRLDSHPPTHPPMGGYHLPSFPSPQWTYPPAATA